MAERRAFTVADASHARLLGQRYELLDRLAVGGMAEVWRATDRVLDRPVAVKLLKGNLAGDPVAVRRFRQEAVAASRLSHPSIIPVFDTVSEGVLQAIVMELVPGPSLRRHLDETGVVTPAEAVRVGRQVASALDTAHRAGLIHRDIKPANILLHPDGRVLVTDFGIAKALVGGEDLTADHLMMGTAKYLAPEQVTGDRLDGRADLFALGVVLYEALCGSPPFVAETDAATALARLHRDPVPVRLRRPDVPPELAEVIEQCLARDPDDRPPTGASLAGRLARAATARTPSHGSEVTRDLRREAITADPTPPAVVADHHRHDPATRTPAAHRVPGRRTPTQRATRLAVALLIAVGIATAAALAASSSRPRPAPPTAGAAPVAAATTVPAPFVRGIGEVDPPPGDGREDPGGLLALVDGDALTGWSTERYGAAAWERKGGVGLVLELTGDGPLGTLTVTSPDAGWGLEVRAAATNPGPRERWPEPIARADDVRGDAVLDLRGHRGRFLLLWITTLPPAEGRSSLTITGIALTAPGSP